MFDHSEEDEDTENQVKKATPDTSDADTARGQREGTPGPQPANGKEGASDHRQASQSDSTTINAVADTDTKKE